MLTKPLKLPGQEGSRQAKEVGPDSDQQDGQTRRVRSRHYDQDAQAFIQRQNVHGFSRPTIKERKEKTEIFIILCFVACNPPSANQHLFVFLYSLVISPISSFFFCFHH